LERRGAQKGKFLEINGVCARWCVDPLNEKRTETVDDCKSMIKKEKRATYSKAVNREDRAFYYQMLRKIYVFDKKH
jgi:hypothetical protein